MIKQTLQAAASFTTVLGLYLSPWMIGLGQQSIAVASPQIQAPRAAIVWMPPPQPAQDLATPEEGARVADTTPAPSPPSESAAPAVEQESADEPSVASVEPHPAPLEPSQAVAEAQTRTSGARSVPRRHPRAAKGVSHPKKPDLDGDRSATTGTRKAKRQARKKQRRRDRWERKQDRLAKQPQCRDHLEEMVKIEDDGRSTRWMVSEDLVRCYRTYPGQFANLGGMDWAKDDRGRKRGLEIYVSRRERGDVARAIGLERGDVLTKLNGLSLRKLTTATLALTQLTRGQAKLQFIRDGERHVLEVSVVDGGAIEAMQRAQQTFAPDHRRMARAGVEADR